MKKLFILLLIAGAAAAGWWARPHLSPAKTAGTAGAVAERKVLFYQSAMHPWIKSDKPGRCTICGMELTPVFEGQQALDASAEGNIVPLTQTQIQVLHVQTVEAKVQPLVKTLRVAGMIDDDERRHRIISAYVDGRIDMLFANHHGVEVIAGEPLALLYSPTLLQAEREYRQLSGDLRKNTALRLRQMGLSPEQIAALPTKPDDDLNTEILAPLSGTVVEHNVYAGQYVEEGQNLFEIADFSVMWFMFRAYEQDMPWLKLGLTVNVTTPSVPGQVFTGKISFIDPNFDQATRSTPVRVEIPNPMVDGRRQLLHRLYADGAVTVEIPQVLTVPRSAVLEIGPEAVVYVDRGSGSYERTVVQIGRRGDALVEMISGLKAGDAVVTNGNLLIDGQAEMNRSFMSPAPAETPLASLTEAQKQAVTDFVKLADTMAEALAADDLARFNKVSEPAVKQTSQLIAAFRNGDKVSQTMGALEQTSHFHGFDGIQKARVAFHSFTVAATAALEPLRHVKGSPEFQVWECMMVDQIIPNVKPKARWVQVGGRPGHNPFFGSDMLDCAVEIKL